MTLHQIAHYGYTSSGFPEGLTQRYDGADSLYASWEYDGSRRVTRSVHGSPTGSIDQTTFAYSASGAVVTDANNHAVTTTPSILHGRAKANGFSGPCPTCNGDTYASRTYDNNGYPDVQVDFSGVSTDFDYSPEGLVVRKVEAANDTTGAKNTIETAWHSDFRKPIQRDTLDAADVLKQRATWSYNTRGQVLQSSISDTALALMRTTAMMYCEDSDVTSGICPLEGLLRSVDGSLSGTSDVTTYTYYPTDDATCATAPTTCPHRKGDLWKVTNALGQVTETLRYDGAGRVLSVKDANGVITDLEYHPRGWLTARKVRGADDASEADDQVTRIEYWPTGLVKKVTQPDGAFTSYEYDAAHRLVAISDNAGNRIAYLLDNAGNRIQENTQDAGGNLKRTLSRLYNQLGQLATVADAQANPTDFGYDANGNTTSVTDTFGRETRNEYDPLNRLKRTLQDVGGIAAETTFEYDALDNLTKVTDPKGLDTTYSYNGLGDLLQLSSPDTGTTSYTYDSAGNRTTQTDARGVTTGYSYDALNRLTAIAYPDSSLNVAYVYDITQPVCTAGETFAVGRLAAMTDGSGSTQYCYDRFGHLVRKVQTTNGQAFQLRYAYTKSGQLQHMVYPDGAVVDYVR
ncbi:type IV secretion protein Rhs, partial [Pseudoxanthomonas wuyuanensis]